MTELMNPFESTFDLLQSLRDEINEVRLAVVEEKQERARETSELRQLMIELTHAKNEKFDNMINTVEELRQAKNSRFDKLEAYVEEFKAIKNQRFDILDQKVETEIDHREASCRALDKTIQKEISQVVNYAQKIHKEIQEHAVSADLFHGSSKVAHEDLCKQVDDLKMVLRDNSMTRDPHKHFRARPGTVASTMPLQRPAFAGTPASGSQNPFRPASSSSSPPSARGNLFSDNNPQSPSALPELPSPTR